MDAYFSEHDFLFRTPEGVQDVSKYPVVFAALLEDTTYEWTEEDLGKVASGNLIRVFKEVEAVRDSLADEAARQNWIPVGDFEPDETQCKSEFGK